MNIGKAIQSIRKEKNMTQEEFGKLFHVTRQTVSNWENEKSFPDLQTLVDMSDMFDISLDKLLKENKEMVKSVSDTFKDGVRWKLFKKIAVCIVIMIVILGAAYICLWNSSKIKTEAKFNEGIEKNSFVLEDGVYVWEAADNITFSLPNQVMPPFYDFRLDFHAKFLYAELKSEEDIIGIRWLDDTDVWLDFNGLKYLTDENGDFRCREDDTRLEDITGDAAVIYKKLQEEIENILVQGTEIYRSVYK